MVVLRTIKEGGDKQANKCQVRLEHRVGGSPVLKVLAFQPGSLGLSFLGGREQKIL